jgi:hypothetical protein
MNTMMSNAQVVATATTGTVFSFSPMPFLGPAFGTGLDLTFANTVTPFYPGYTYNTTYKIEFGTGNDAGYTSEQISSEVIPPR